MLGLFWFIVGGALGLGFWGVVLAFILKWGKKLDRLPRWPITAGLAVGGIVGALQYASY